MRKLSWFNRIVLALNLVLAALTILSYALPYIAPQLMPLPAVLTLFLPVLLVANLLVFCYWLLLSKKQMLWSGIVLLLGLPFLGKFYQVGETELAASDKDFTVMSYNVRLFDLFDWMQKTGVKDSILGFINTQNPSIVCLQEYSKNAKVNLRVYTYKAIHMGGKRIKTGQAIFSKFPILGHGELALPHSNNNIIFADIRKGKDTLRIYSMHLESIRISPDVREIEANVDQLNRSKSEQLFQRLRKGFIKQQQQAEILAHHARQCPYPTLICGDMNNSAFSYVYRLIRGDLNDCFTEAGKGFGQTYQFKYYPARIDYIFADPQLSVKDYQGFPNFVYSDHFPIMARLAFKD